jgi:hypothetical protein
MKPIFLISFCCLLLAGCGETASNINISAKPIEIDIAKTADPETVRMLPVTFKVVNKNNLDPFISSLSKEQSTNNPVFIAITTKDYENLSLNLADLRRYIEDQKAIIVYYRELTTHNSTIPQSTAH